MAGSVEFGHATASALVGKLSTARSGRGAEGIRGRAPKPVSTSRSTASGKTPRWPH
ncbi:hypothetical protein [Nocardia sp. NPDC046763]|uniref:hypothetical protein n=1 Tax=Nocardia sp. NPDC046763 TaxID=3155256 RepID=UPI0033FD4D7D